MKIRRQNDEVLYAKDRVILISRKEIGTMKAQARRNPRQRVRICTHRDIADRHHEMIIAHRKNTYIRPHQHAKKPESLHVVEGRALLVCFTTRGRITSITWLGNKKADDVFYCRLPGGIYHTLFILSDWFIFHETTPGPFVKRQTLFPSWAPNEGEEGACAAFMSRLRKRIRTRDIR